MKLLALYWSFMIVAYILAAGLRKKKAEFPRISEAMMIVVYFLCFDMGLRMGINEEVTSGIGTIGAVAFLVTVCCIAGSMAATTVTRKIFRMDRYGNLPGMKYEGEKEASAAGGEARFKSLRTSLMIVLVVGGGMSIGAFVIAGKFAEHLQSFDDLSYIGLVIMLCILLFLVGFDIGAKGSIFETIRRVGFRVLAFPVAAIAGTMIVGTIAYLILGFTMKESLAICAGFGWYSYAPIVIAGGGPQFAVASAVSFLHNVMREVSGILFLPVLARNFGYIESTAVPGSAAMDVCMPIVEHSCRPDTVIYSFTTGLVMCIATSVGVPLIMGL